MWKKGEGHKKRIKGEKISSSSPRIKTGKRNCRRHLRQSGGAGEKKDRNIRKDQEKELGLTLRRTKDRNRLRAWEKKNPSTYR